MTALATALVAAQATIEGAKKDSTNPHFRSTYADLASVWDACRDALHAHGLCVVQYGDITEAGPVLVTKLLHASGESIEGVTPLLNGKGDMQGLGSAWTYARRYGLAAMVGVCPEDDDGNAASEKPPAKVAPVAAPEGYAQFIVDLRAAAKKGTGALKTEWLESPTELRAHMTMADPKGWEALKAEAAAVSA